MIFIGLIIGYIAGIIIAIIGNTAKIDEYENKYNELYIKYKNTERELLSRTKKLEEYYENFRSNRNIKSNNYATIVEVDK